MAEDPTTAGAEAAEPPWWKGPHFRILAGVLFLLITFPLLEGSPLGTRVAEVGLFVLLISSYFGAGKGPGLLRTLIFLVLLKGAIEVVLLFAPSEFAASAPLPGAVITGLVVFRMMQFLLTARRITPDLIFASIATYLFLGLLAAQVFKTLVLASPGSLDLSGFPEDLRGDTGNPTSILMLYYAFVTLTTLGFGDIAPKSPATMIVTALVAVSGQMYMAIVIARLVSLQFIAPPRGDP